MSEHHIESASSFRDDSDMVFMDGEPLDLAASLKVWNHSPSGFAWGYAGSGPAQLALAILMRVTDNVTAGLYHQKFKFAYVAHWDQFRPLNETVDVDFWLAQQQEQHA